MRVTKMLLRSPRKASSSSSYEDSESPSQRRSPPSTSRSTATKSIHSSRSICAAAVRVKRDSVVSKNSKAQHQLNILTRNSSKRLRRGAHQHNLNDIENKRENEQNGSISKPRSRGIVLNNTKDEEHSGLSEDDNGEEVEESDGFVLEQTRSENAVGVVAIEGNDDEEGEDGHNACGLSEEWIDQVATEYDIVRDIYENIVATQGVQAFRESFSTPRNFELHNGETPSTFLIDECVNENYPLAFLRNENNSVIQRAPLIPLEHIEATPRMQYWTLTEVNINAEDEYTLSHIPFLGDAEDDTTFCEELMKTFPDGIHGTRVGCGEYINDWILYYLVKACRAKLTHLDEKTIYRCIHDQFPNKASVQGLTEVFPDLQIRFEPHMVDRQDLMNADGELVANFSASRLLNSYELLLCHKCFSYDCTMHNATVADSYGTDRRKGRVKEMDTTPCGSKCFMNFAHHHRCHYENTSMGGNSRRDSKSTTSIGQLGGGGSHSGKDMALQLNVDISNNLRLTSSMTSPRNNSNGKSSENGQKFSTWSPHEEALYNILRATGEDNYCRITKMLNAVTSKKKTCREVYEYACRATPLSPRLDLIPSPVKTTKKKIDTHRTFRAVKWASTNGKVENNSMYKPCSHHGECKKENGCRCATVDNLCTKHCGCSDNCQIRFPGCRCTPGNCRTKQCQCYYASWECDPDICKSCNCDKFDGSGEPICKNVSIQRGLQKRLLVAPSQVAGWGCFSNEDIEKNEFVSEYCGEVISQSECERRGKIYDKIKCSYLFTLNEEQVVDATRVGNVIRFANHSRNPNCRAKVIVVNGDHKIGIFANRRINKGEELFFDYAYNKSQQVQFLSKELPKDFYQS